MMTLFTTGGKHQVGYDLFVFHLGTVYNNNYRNGLISSDSKYNDDRDNRDAAAFLVLGQSSSSYIASFFISISLLIIALSICV
jgi:hypothetical protein